MRRPSSSAISRTVTRTVVGAYALWAGWWLAGAFVIVGAWPLTGDWWANLDLLGECLSSALLPGLVAWTLWDNARLRRRVVDLRRGAPQLHLTFGDQPVTVPNGAWARRGRS